MFKERISLYKKIEELFDTNLLVYITSDRRGMEAQIAQDVIDFFIDHLDAIGPVSKITLFLYTRGGDTAAAWNIVNLIKMYCDNFEVIIPHKAHSAGTLISIGAKSIIMTKQATLGPIDPSLNTPLNPNVPNSNQTYPVSVEAVKGYIALIKEELGIKDDIALSNILLKLSDKVHPLVLGQVYRTRAQIKMLANKLLSPNIENTKIESIISFLCSDSGSHDYTINRREAKEHLGLNIVIPSVEQYKLIRQIYDNLANELQFNSAFNPLSIEEDYNIKRCLLESIPRGSDSFVTQGRISKINLSNGQLTVQDNRIFEGWRHENNEN